MSIEHDPEQRARDIAAGLDPRELAAMDPTTRFCTRFPALAAKIRREEAAMIVARLQQRGRKLPTAPPRRPVQRSLFWAATIQDGNR